MKNILIACFCIVAVLLGCESKELAVSQNDIGVNISKGQNESAVIKNASDLTHKFEVKVLAIDDSRCPSDVVCVHAGWASVDFKINDLSFTLGIGESFEFTIHNQQFKLTLIDVVPYPTTTNQDERKKAIFVVDKVL